jgi:hypothetical protein
MIHHKTSIHLSDAKVLLYKLPINKLPLPFPDVVKAKTL